MHFPQNQDDILEFLVSFHYEYNKKGVIRFRIGGDSFRVTRNDMRDWFGFNINNTLSMESSFNANRVWEDLTGIKSFVPKNFPNKLIRDNCLLILHKYLATSVCCRAENTKVQKDLFLLSCAMKKK